MSTVILDRDQGRLLDEIKILIPQFNESEVAGVLKSAISQLKKCNRVSEAPRAERTTLSPKIRSLIGVIPPISQSEIDGDDRLEHILNH